jgi:hypothetical protein
MEWGGIMGVLCGIKCTVCDYEEIFTLGGCAMDYPIKMTAGHLTDKFSSSKYSTFSKQEKARLRLEIKNAFKQPDVFVKDEPYGWNFYYCHSCDNLLNLFTFYILFTEGLYIPEYRCPTCQLKLELLHERNINLNGRKPSKRNVSILTKDKVRLYHKCPKCGAATCEDDKMHDWIAD